MAWLLFLFLGNGSAHGLMVLFSIKSREQRELTAFFLDWNVFMKGSPTNRLNNHKKRLFTTELLCIKKVHIKNKKGYPLS